MAGASGKSGGLRRRSGGGLSKATGRGREARKSYRFGRTILRGRRSGG